MGFIAGFMALYALLLLTLAPFVFYFVAKKIGYPNNCIKNHILLWISFILMSVIHHWILKYFNLHISIGDHLHVMLVVFLRDVLGILIMVGLSAYIFKASIKKALISVVIFVLLMVLMGYLIIILGSGLFKSLM